MSLCTVGWNGDSIKHSVTVGERGGAEREEGCYYRVGDAGNERKVANNVLIVISGCRIAP